MSRREIDIYAAADRAIRQMNREMLREFGKLKLANFDELNVVRTVNTLYRKQEEQAKRRYLEIATEGYLLGLFMVGISGTKAYGMMEKTITPEWVNERMERVDPVTLYRFDTETERKAQRLIEILSASAAPGREIDRAMKLWSKQVGQYAIGITDEAVLGAYADADVEMVRWVTAQDERVCEDCEPLDGKIFPIDAVPPKPHWGCRCRLVPAD